jgi:hypothetical protein
MSVTVGTGQKRLLELRSTDLVTTGEITSGGELNVNGNLDFSGGTQTRSKIKLGSQKQYPLPAQGTKMRILTLANLTSCRVYIDSSENSYNQPIVLDIFYNSQSSAKPVIHRANNYQWHTHSNDIRFTCDTSGHIYAEKVSYSTGRTVNIRKVEEFKGTVTILDGSTTQTGGGSSDVEEGKFGSLSITGNITLGGTVDGVDIATRDGILSGTTITANSALQKAGGTMTGALTLSGAPSSNLHAATKAYVDGAIIANTDTQDLSISGQTLSLTNGGSVTLPDADTQDLSISGRTISLTDGGSVTVPAPTYASVTGKPTTFAPSSHTHTFASLTSKPTTISGYGITDALAIGTTSTTALAGNTSIPSISGLASESYVDAKTWNWNDITAGTVPSTILNSNVTLSSLGAQAAGSYLTSYTETDTLATVTARGATTSTTMKQGSYTRLLTGHNSTGQITFNANYDGGQTNTYTPDYSGNTGAGMSIIRMPSGGQGGIQFYVKKSGTTSTSQNLSTFTKQLELKDDGTNLMTATTVSDLTVTGNLTITGDIDSYNTTTLDVTDKTISVSKGGTAALADGAGLIVDRGSSSDATILWDHSNSRFNISNDVQIANGLTVGDSVVANGVTLTGTQTTVSGNAGTVTNGVYTTGNQTIGGIKEFTSEMRLGTYNSTVGGVLSIYGTTANKRSILQTTNGNLHVDSADGHATYINYYTGASSTNQNVIFGSGDGGVSGAYVRGDGRIVGTTLQSTGAVVATSLDINGNADIAGNLSLSGDNRILNLAGGTTSSQSKVIIGEQGLYGVSFRWDSSSELDFDGFWATDVTGARNRDLGKVNVNSRLWTFNEHVVVGGELEALSLDINGNADISGDLTGVDALSAETLLLSGNSTNVPLYLRSAGTTSYLQIHNSSTGTNGTNDGLTVGCNGTAGYLWLREAASLNIGTNDTSALTIDSSQNSTFAGTVAASNLSGTNTGDETVTDSTSTTSSTTVASATAVKSAYDRGSLGVTNAAAAAQTANGALQKAGGTMTGKITLDGSPTSNLHAATKAYVDGAVIANTDTQDLSISGTTLSLTNSPDVTIPQRAVSDSTSTTSSTTAASSTAVKSAYDRGSTGVTNAASAQTTANAALPKSGGSMSGNLLMGNGNITGVNMLEFNDAGPGEGIQWNGGNMKIYESPDDLTTNTAGNLQIVYGSTRRLTVNNSGIYVNGTATIGNLTNAGTDTDRFLVADTNKVVRFRTGAELRADIGAGTGNSNLVIGTTSTTAMRGDYTGLLLGTTSTRALRGDLVTTTSSTSTTQAATANAVRLAYNRGSLGVTNAATALGTAQDAATSAVAAQATANAALPKAGGTMTGNITLGSNRIIGMPIVLAASSGYINQTPAQFATAGVNAVYVGSNNYGWNDARDWATQTVITTAPVLDQNDQHCGIICPFNLSQVSIHSQIRLNAANGTMQVKVYKMNRASGVATSNLTLTEIASNTNVSTMTGRYTTMDAVGTTAVSAGDIIVVGFGKQDSGNGQKPRFNFTLTGTLS